MIKYSKYKEFYYSFDQEKYKNVGEFFNKSNSNRNKNRLYFDLEVDPKRFESEMPRELEEYLNWFGHYNADFSEGTCDYKGRRTRIGKVLNKEGQSDLLKVYQNSKDKTLKNVKDLKVVISRHPYDIIGMSTDRGWSTCVDLYDRRYKGRFLYSLKRSLQDGDLVAYLIRKGDENINKPLSRITIQRSNFNGKYNPATSVYGTNVKEFRECLVDWCNKINKDL